MAGPYPGGPYTLVNTAVGAGIFYNTGLFGERSVIGNVEAGFVWGGHEVFNRTGSALGPAVAQQIVAPDNTGQLDFHATMVGHVLAGTGYIPATGTSSAAFSNVAIGMAPAAAIWSGAIATAYSTSTASIGSFSTTPASTVPVYRQMFQGISGTRADVVNSSFGYTDPAALDQESLAIDALAWENPTVTFVAAAGNDDVTPVFAPGNVYNGITVGSVGGAGFGTPSEFSSRGPVDFYNPQTSGTLVGVRAAVDIAAPGEQQFLAAYLGPTGGLAPLTTITQDPSPTDRYFVNQDGTSFASPLVAGGVALMKDAAKYFALPETAFDSRVVKAVLMATADETAGWNNGQTTVDGVVRTTQALDYATGAGLVNLTIAGRTYVEATTLDVSGTTGGTIGGKGWDLGAVTVGGANDYLLGTTLTGTTQLQVALNWFTGGAFDAAGDSGTRTSFANLDLQVWSVASGSFASLVAESASLYNNAELLRLILPEGDYGLRVSLPQMIYDTGTTAVTAETYGLSWNTVAVPEPATTVLAAAGAVLAGIACRRRRRAGKAARGATVMDGPGGRPYDPAAREKNPPEAGSPCRCSSSEASPWTASRPPPPAATTCSVARLSSSPMRRASSRP
ncbi:MAG: S8 family serine peptidase [Planctomycetia bacterium]